MGNKFENWEKLRAKGIWNFILIYGALLWGVSVGVLFSLFFPVVFYLTMGDKVSLLEVFAGSIIIFPLGGIVWAYFMWIFTEKAYAKEKISE